MRSAAFAGGFMGGLIIGFPIPVAIAPTPDEKNLTLIEVAARVASETHELPSKQQ